MLANFACVLMLTKHSSNTDQGMVDTQELDMAGINTGSVCV